MRKFAVIESALKLASGRVVLTKRQSDSRIKNLKLIKQLNEETGTAIWEIVNQIMFKVGEVIEYDGQLTRTQADQLDEVQEVETVNEIVMPEMAAGKPISDDDKKLDEKPIADGDKKLDEKPIADGDKKLDEKPRIKLPK